MTTGMSIFDKLFQEDSTSASPNTKVVVTLGEKNVGSWEVQDLTPEQAEELMWKLLATTERFIKKLEKQEANTITVS